MIIHKTNKDGTVTGTCRICGAIFNDYTYGKMALQIANHTLKLSDTHGIYINWANEYVEHFTILQNSQRKASKLRKQYELEQDNQYIS